MDFHTIANIIALTAIAILVAIRYHATHKP